MENSKKYLWQNDNYGSQAENVTYIYIMGTLINSTLINSKDIYQNLKQKGNWNMLL